MNCKQTCLSIIMTLCKDHVILLHFGADLNKRLCSRNHIIVVLLVCFVLPFTVDFACYDNANGSTLRHDNINMLKFITAISH